MSKIKTIITLEFKGGKMDKKRTQNRKWNIFDIVKLMTGQIITKQNFTDSFFTKVKKYWEKN